MDPYQRMMSINSPMSNSSRPLITGRGAGHKSVRGPKTPRSQQDVMTPRSQTSGGSRPGTSGGSRLQSFGGSRPGTSGGSRPQTSGGARPQTSESPRTSNKNRIQLDTNSTGSNTGFFESGHQHLSGVLGTLGGPSKQKKPSQLSDSSFSQASNADLLCDVSLPVTPIGKHTSTSRLMAKSPGTAQMFCWPGLHEALEAAAPPSQNRLQSWPGLGEALEAAAPESRKSQQNAFRNITPLYLGSHAPPAPHVPPPDLQQTLQQEIESGSKEPLGILHSETKLEQENRKPIKGLLRYLQNSLPPMKNWLKREISKVSLASKHTRSTATLKSVGSAKTLQQSENGLGDATRSASSPSKRHAYSEGEVNQAIFMQQQFPGNAVLRGELQSVADEMKMKKAEKAHATWDNQRRCREADRQRIRRNREMKRGREERIQREEQHRLQLEETFAQQKATETKEEASPKAGAKAETENRSTVERVMPAAMGFIQMLKPTQPLKTRLKMINNLAKAHQQERGTVRQSTALTRGSTGAVARKTMGWGMIKMAVNSDSPEPASPIVSAENLKLLKETFHRYDADKSGFLETPEIHPAVQDCGICPKVREEKIGCTQILKEVIVECGTLGLDFQEFVMLIHRMRTKIADVQRMQLEDLYIQACDDRGTFNKDELKKILEEVAHVRVKEREMIEIHHEFRDFQSGRKWMTPEQVEVLRKHEEAEKEKRKLLWSAEQMANQVMANDDEDPIMKHFDEFESNLTKAREKLAAMKREEERQIAEDHKLSEEVFEDFRVELVELDELFSKYDEDESGLLDPDEVREVLTDFGCAPKTILEQKALNLMFWEIKYPNKMPPEKLQIDKDVEFSFSEFLTLVRRLRKMNADLLKSRLMSDFNRYDRDKSGELDMQEVARILQDMNLIPRSKEEQYEILAIFEEVDEDGSQTFNFKEFQVLIIRVRERLEKIAHQRAQDHALAIGLSLPRFKELLSLFQNSDEEGTNKIWVPQLRYIMDKLGKAIDSESLHELFEEFCEEHDGQEYLGIREFCNMMKEIDDGVLYIPDQRRRAKSDKDKDKDGKKKKKKKKKTGEDGEALDGDSSEGDPSSSPDNSPRQQQSNP